MFCSFSSLLLSASRERDSLSFALHREMIFLASRRRFRLRMNCHGFPKACDHKYLFDHRLDRFDHRLDRFDHPLSKRCSALGCINTLADWSTFKSAAGTVPNSHSHSRACIKSNTHSYADSQPDTITKRSTCRHASPTFTPSQIALHPVRVIRVYNADGNVIETHEKGTNLNKFRHKRKAKNNVVPLRFDQVVWSWFQTLEITMKTLILAAIRCSQMFATLLFGSAGIMVRYLSRCWGGL